MKYNEKKKTHFFNENHIILFPPAAIVFVYDYHAGAETLASRHFSSPAALSASGWEGLVNSHGGTGGNSPHDPSSRSLHKSHRHNSGNSKFIFLFYLIA